MPSAQSVRCAPESALVHGAATVLGSALLGMGGRQERRFVGHLAVDAAAAAESPAGAMAAETRPELVGKRFLCLAVGEEARPERREGGRSRRGWRAGVIRAVSHRDCRNPDLAVRERRPHPPSPRLHPTFSQPYRGLLPLAPCSAGQLAVTPLGELRTDLPTSPGGVAASLHVAVPMGAVTELDFLASAGPRPRSSAPVPEGVGRGARAAPGRPPRPF